MPIFEFLHRTDVNPFFFFGLLFILILPTLWAIWHIVHHTFSTPTERTAWLLCVMLFPVIGGIVYFFKGRPRARRTLSSSGA